MKHVELGDIASCSQRDVGPVDSEPTKVVVISTCGSWFNTSARSWMSLICCRFTD